MVGSAIATLGTMFFIWFGSGIQFGFGSLELPVTILSSSFDARYPITDFNAFETQAIGLFLSQCFLATLFLQFLYCRGILLFSALFRSELINLLVAGFCLLSPFLSNGAGLVPTLIKRCMSICIKMWDKSFQAGHAFTLVLQDLRWKKAYFY